MQMHLVASQPKEQVLWTTRSYRFRSEDILIL